jgi:hypothetical protein
VAKADGTREVLDQVRPETALQIFAGMDWDRELRAVEAAQETGDESYIPEFGLTDDEERLLVISPVDGDTVTFWIQSPAYGWNVERFPKSEVPALLEQYFAADDEALQAIAAQHQPVRELQLHELSEAEFAATTSGHMQWVGAVETFHQVPLRDYLGACIDARSLPTSLETIELTNLYRADDGRHSHVLFNYADPATALVLVVKHDPEEGDSVIGHRFVSLAEGGYPP